MKRLLIGSVMAIQYIVEKSVELVGILTFSRGPALETIAGMGCK